MPAAVLAAAEGTIAELAFVFLFWRRGCFSRRRIGGGGIRSRHDRLRELDKERTPVMPFPGAVQVQVQYCNSVKLSPPRASLSLKDEMVRGCRLYYVWCISILLAGS